MPDGAAVVPPLVSILLPTFNRVEFLPATIDSVLAQTYPDWELLIADDGSSGEARGYLEGLARHPRVQVQWLPHCGKPAVMLNAAARRARGAYLAFLDSDDVWLPRKLEQQICALERQPDRQWSCTAFELMGPAGLPLAGRHTLWPAAEGWVRERLLTDAVIAMASVVVSRRLLEEVGPLDEELVMCYDDELWLRLAARSALDGVAEPLTRIRRHAMHGGSDIIAWRDRRRVVEKALRAGGDVRFNAVLREQRALMSAGLARSQAVGGQRSAALRTLAASAPYSWRYARWWSRAFAAAARACAPRALRAAIRVMRT